MDILGYVWIVVAVLLAIAAASFLIILPILAYSIKSVWFCKYLNYHPSKLIAVHIVPKDGAAGVGVCLRCGKKVTTDYFGNWG